MCLAKKFFMVFKKIILRSLFQRWGTHRNSRQRRKGERGFYFWEGEGPRDISFHFPLKESTTWVGVRGWTGVQTVSPGEGVGMVQFMTQACYPSDPFHSLLTLLPKDVVWSPIATCRSSSSGPISGALKGVVGASSSCLSEKLLPFFCLLKWHPRDSAGSQEEADSCFVYTVIFICNTAWTFLSLFSS